MGQFCTFGAIESAYLGNDQRRIRLWGLVLGTAIITIYGLDFFGQFNISDTSYHRINWNPIGSIIGGLLFGYGMGLAGNCGFGALAKLAGGDLRSLVILIVMALASYFILSGPLAGLRIILFIGSMIKGHFRWEACEDARELGRQMLGAVLMGFGSVIAMGCSIGQGVSAFSTLAISGPITLAAIIIGSIIAIRQILTGYQP